MNRRNEIVVALSTLVRKEVKRYLRIWVQTLVPPAVTMSLYFVIFGTLIGPRIGSMDGLDYIQFMIPGLIMMSVITNSYANVVSSFYSVKFQKSIEELLVSPSFRVSSHASIRYVFVIIIIIIVVVVIVVVVLSSIVIVSSGNNM